MTLRYKRTGTTTEGNAGNSEKRKNNIPYSGKFSREEKTFAFRYIQNENLLRKLSLIAPVKIIIMDILCRYECGHKISGRKLSRGFLKREKPRKFSPSKVFAAIQ